MATSNPRLLTCLSIVALVAGCTAAPGSGSPLPSSFADRVPVTGATKDCGLQDLRTTDTSGGVQTQTATLHCTYEMSDPRVSGLEEAKLTMHWVQGANPEVDYYLVEDDVLTNDGGTWRGSGWGSEYNDESGDWYTTGTSLFVGEGGYAGLSYRMLLAREGLALAGRPYMVSGWIEPTD